MASKDEAFTKPRLKELTSLIDFFTPDKPTYPFASWLQDAELHVHRTAHASDYTSDVFTVFDGWKEATDRGERSFIYSPVKNVALFDESVMALARLYRGALLPHPLIGFDQQVTLEIARQPRGILRINFTYADAEAGKRYRSILDKLVVA